MKPDRPNREAMFKARNRIENYAKTRGLSEEAAMDVAFHIYDWLEDLERFIAYTKDSESFDDDQLDDMLRGFLIHAPNHIAAAAKLFTGYGVKDIFGVGVCNDDIERVGD